LTKKKGERKSEKKRRPKRGGDENTKRLAEL